MTLNKHQLTQWYNACTRVVQKDPGKRWACVVGWPEDEVDFSAVMRLLPAEAMKPIGQSITI